MAIVWDPVSEIQKLAVYHLQPFSTASYNKASLATVSASNGIGFWRISKSANSQPFAPAQLSNWKLQWITRHTLDITRMQVEEVKISREQDRNLLQQRETIGTPNFLL